MAAACTLESDRECSKMLESVRRRAVGGQDDEGPTPVPEFLLISASISQCKPQHLKQQFALSLKFLLLTLCFCGTEDVSLEVRSRSRRQLSHPAVARH